MNIGPCVTVVCFFQIQLEVMLEDNVCLPSNGKLYTKVINWVQRSIWENGDSLEELMEEVSFKVNGIQQFLKIILL